MNPSPTTGSFTTADPVVVSVVHELDLRWTTHLTLLFEVQQLLAYYRHRIHPDAPGYAAAAERAQALANRVEKRGCWVHSEDAYPNGPVPEQEERA